MELSDVEIKLPSKLVVVIVPQYLTTEFIATCINTIGSQYLRETAKHFGNSIPLDFLGVATFVTKKMCLAGIKVKTEITKEYATWTLMKSSQRFKLAKLLDYLVETAKLDVNILDNMASRNLEKELLENKKKLKEKNKGRKETKQKETKSIKEKILPLKDQETDGKLTESKTKLDTKENGNTQLENEQKIKKIHKTERNEKPTQLTKEKKYNKPEISGSTTKTPEIKQEMKEKEEMETNPNEMEIKFNKLKKMLTQNQDEVKDEQGNEKKMKKMTGIDEENEIKKGIGWKENENADLECKPPPNIKMNGRMQEKGEPPPERK